MNQEEAIIRSKSRISYNYATVRLTQSRIDKGLIAVPIALAKWFPDRNADIQVYLGDSPILKSKRYSSLGSSTKECRIGGVRQWFQDNDLKSGDEIVVQVIDKENLIYRLLPEHDFVAATEELQSNFDNSMNELEASEKLVRLSQWTNTQKSSVILNEYRRLAATAVPAQRPLTKRRSSRSRESTPPNVRTLLGRLYQGHCQVCDFWFPKRNNEPYFEIHHLDAMGGHHPKNLIVVCGNCHNQFEYADVVPQFSAEHWLITVHFNRILHRLNQIALTTPMPEFAKESFV